MSTENNGNRELPFNCQIAAVLGWTGLHQINGLWVGFDGQETKEVPGFGETWCSTGKILEQMQPTLTVKGWYLTSPTVPNWEASKGGVSVTAETACEAVGKLVLKLHSLGLGIK